MTSRKPCDLAVGDVVYNNDTKMVIIDAVINEDIGACSYDRKYKLCTLDELTQLLDESGSGLLNPTKFTKLGYWVHVTGTAFPDIQYVSDAAPFEIVAVTYHQIRRKVPKYITIYE